MQTLRKELGMDRISCKNLLSQLITQVIVQFNSLYIEVYYIHEE